MPRFVLAALALAVPAAAGAQSSEVTVRVSLPVTEAVGVLEVTTASTDFGTLSFEAMSQGWAERQGPLVAARANLAFSVVVSAPDPFSGPTSKTADELWITTDGASWTPLSASGFALVSTTAGESVSLAPDYRWLLGFESDPPGLYSLTVHYRLEGG